MRKRESNSRRIVVGITVLCNLLTIQIAWPAENWQLALPAADSTRTKTSNVSGNGMTNAPQGATAVFAFERPDPDPQNVGEFIVENDMIVTAGMMAWSGTLNPPTGATWTVSPKDGTGHYIGNHYASITFDGGVRNHTSGHVVTNE